MGKNTLYQKIANLPIKGFALGSSPPQPAGNYVAVKKVGNTAYVSGQMSVFSSGETLKRPNIVNISFGYEAAKLAMAQAFKQLLYCEEINEIDSILRIDGYFCHEHGKNLPKMLDGASDLVAELFESEKSTHARTVFGVAALPYNAFVEVVVIAEVS
ncbi:MAG: RidA family protein [Bacteroidota bacterium]